MKKIFCIVLLAAFALAPRMAQAYWLDIGAGYWNPTPTGELAYNTGGSTDPALDMDKDFGADSEGFAQLRVKADLPGINVGLMTTPMEFTGSGTATDFGGVNFAGDYDTTLTMDQTDGTIFWAVPFLDLTGMLNVEFGLNVKLVNFETEVSAAGTTASQSFSLTVPMVYLGAQVKPTDSFHIEAEYRGLSIGDNEYTDIMAKLKWLPVPLFNVSAGYRMQTINLDEEGIKSDLEFAGPFAEIGFQF